MIGVNIDITDRKQAEEALRESEAQTPDAQRRVERRVEERTAELMAVTKTLKEENVQRARTEALLRESEENTGCWLKVQATPSSRTCEWVVLFINERAAQVLGGQPQDFTGKTHWDLFPKQIADRRSNQVRRVISSGKRELNESTLPLNGVARYYFTTFEPLKDASGRISSALVMSCDVTERNLVQQALEQSEQKYHRLFDTVPDAIIFFDAQTRQIIDVNKSADRFTATLGRNSCGFLRMTRQLSRRKPAKQLFVCWPEIRFWCRCDTIARKMGLRFRWRSRPATLSSVTAELLPGAIRDISDRIQSQRQLETYQKDLQSMAEQVLLAEEQERPGGWPSIYTMDSARFCRWRTSGWTWFGTRGEEKLDGPLRRSRRTA